MTDDIPLLAWDLSTPATVVALRAASGEAFLYRDIGSGRSGSLFPAILHLLQEADISAKDVGVVGVGRGPGSFTGIRNAVISAKALSWALEVPLLATSTLDILAWGEPGEGMIASIIDARREQVYLRIFLREGESLRPLTAPLALSPDDALRVIGDQTAAESREITLVGTGAHAYLDMFSVLGKVADDPFPKPRGLLLALSAKGTQKPQDPLELTPLYLRDPDAAPREKGNDKGKSGCAPQQD